MSWRAKAVSRGDRGAFLVVFALCLTVLVLVIALVIDLAYTRVDRRNGQLAVDSATSSAAQSFADTGSPRAACLDAFDIASSTLGISSFSGQNCDLLPTAACTTPTSTTQTSGTSGSVYTLTVSYPVADDSELMLNTSTINNAGIAASTDDGDACDRIGVALETAGEPFFGAIAGSTERPSAVHAVALVDMDNKVERPLNLLALERHDCDALEFAGQGNATIEAIFDPETSEYLGGIAASDSDARDCANDSSATIMARGQGNVTANGPCDLNPAVVCPGEGQVLSYATVTGSGTCVGTADTPACREAGTGVITPDVEQFSPRYTRAPIDHRYNCKGSYASEPWYTELEQDIPGCENALASRPYVDELEAFVTSAISSTPLGWTVVQGGACNAEDQDFLGNVIVRCADFKPKGQVRFLNGNVIFTGSMTPRGDATTITIHDCSLVCLDTLSWAPGANYNEAQSSPSAAWAYFADDLSIRNGRTVVFNNTAVFFGSNGRVDQEGGGISWTAPDAEDDFPFDDLAMWSEGTEVHKLRGDGSITLRGVFFNGRSTFDYAGSSNQDFTDAQFVANKMKFAGTGSIRMSPTPDGAVSFPTAANVGLIR